MNCYDLQQRVFVACEEKRGSLTISDQKEPLICPKPLRVGVILEKHMEMFANQVDSSPPFFCVSPPVRTSNPLVKDARFRDDISSSLGFAFSTSVSCKSERVRMSFGLKPAPIRVEGFDCIGMDRQNSSISTFA
ncbi:unnamed protein product [Lathyrus oleraceus]